MSDSLLKWAPNLDYWLNQTPEKLEAIARQHKKMEYIYCITGVCMLLCSAIIALVNMENIYSKGSLFVGFGCFVFSIYFLIQYTIQSRIAFLYQKAKNFPDYTNDATIDVYIDQRKHQGHAWRNLDSLHLELLLHKKINDIENKHANSA